MQRSSVLGSLTLAAAAIATAATPSFYKEVLPVLEKNCQGCHRPGEAAPMHFLDYKGTRPWARAIKSAVAVGKMPPWFADEQSAKFANDRSLSEADRATLVAWADAGAPEGSQRDMARHAPPAWVEGWNIGTPDLTITMPQPFEVPAAGTIEYQYIVIPTNLAEDKWVQMAEVRPGDRTVVNHVIAFIRPSGSRWLADAKPGVPFVPARDGRRRVATATNNFPNEAAPAADPQGNAGLLAQSELLVGYAPGMQAQILEPGTAKLLPAGADLVLQMHYTATGKVATDRTTIGLVFAKEPPVRRDLTISVTNNRFAIPPGDSNFEVKSQLVLGSDAEMINMMPHMHLRGKSFEYRLVLPDGTVRTLLNIPKYDFNWQLVYVLDKPLALPKGSRIECTAHFDNSANNRYNPDPKATVHFGDQTWEEMMIGWFDVTIPAKSNPAELFRGRRTSGD